MGLLLDKPEYFFRPLQLWRRLTRWTKPIAPELRLPLPWGAALSVTVDETIGHSLWHLGIYDLVVSETLWRLADAGETVADVGANIGYVTSLLSAKTGPTGNVWAFEPHPALFARLGENVAGWNGHAYAPVSLFRTALSDKSGMGELLIPEGFEKNAGTAYLRGAYNQAAVATQVSVELATLDQVCDAQKKVPSVIKVDTEGNEEPVFKGAAKALGSGRVRDLVFEDHGAFPTPAMQELLRHGYRLFRLQKNFFGPALAPPDSTPKVGNWEPVSYLATLDEPRCRERFRPKGWKILSARR